LVVSSGKPLARSNHLAPEDAARARARAVVAGDAVLEDIGQQGEILPLRVVGGIDGGDRRVGVHLPMMLR